MSSPIPATLMDNSDSRLLAELLDAVGRVAASGAFIGGPAVEEFEHAFASWCEAPHAVGVASGTDALVLALRALGVGPSDEVVVPANSFIATAEAVSLAGATPRFADVDERTGLMTAATLEPALSPATRCAIPVHLYGRTVELGPILELARSRGVPVIEDAAQAHGARYAGRRVGTIGDAGTFSFYPAKNLGAWGDAGAVVCSDGDLAARVRLLRSHGERPRYHHRVIGSTARLDAVQAAVLAAKLPRLEAANADRRRVAGRLRGALAGSGLVLPAELGAGEDHVYHQFVVRTHRREELRRFLGERGIATGIHYPIPIHRSEAYRSLAAGADPAPVASRIFPAMSAEQVERIGEAAHAFLGARRARAAAPA